ncbi:MAG TPA: SoxR reducing system RseC family protein [Halanaerobiales bacterium]|nr:SoxR reducing system RseC family protein [Halanaerobiales bacterium]
MREKACVVDVTGDTAKVVVTRHSACSKCNKDCILGMEDSHEQDEMYVEVKSKKNVEVGDTVSIELKDSSLVLGSLMIYLIPLLFFVGGYFIGARLSWLFGTLSAEVTGILSSFVFLYLSYRLTKKIDKRISKSEKFQSEIVNIVSKNENI